MFLNRNNMKDTYNKITFLLFISLITIAGFSQNNNAFRFKITGNGYSDETIIRLLNGATQNFDGSYDAWKFFSPNPNVPSIYTQISAGQELSINALPEFSEDKSITIFTNIPVSGSYVVNFEELFALTPNYKISLTDISSTTHYRLMGDSAIIFNFNVQQNSPSFTFNISTELVTSTIDESCIAMNDGSLTINNAGNTDWNATILDSNNSQVLFSTSNVNLNNYSSLSPGFYKAIISSKGIIDEFNFTINPAVNLTADFNLNKDTVYLSEGGEINVTNNSQNAQSFTWDFGDGGVSLNLNPSYIYLSVGNYIVTLLVSNNSCTVNNTKQVTVLFSPSIVTAIQNNKNEILSIINVGNGNYHLTMGGFDKKRIVVHNLEGRKIVNDITYEKNYYLSLSDNSSGIYIISIVSENGQVIKEKVFR